jgi:hypothetical protein
MVVVMRPIATELGRSKKPSAQWLLNQFVFDQCAETKPDFPGWLIRQLLVGVAIVTRTACGTRATRGENGIKFIAMRSCDVSHGDRLEVQATIVDHSEVGSGELMRGEGNIHQVLLVLTLGWGDERVVHFSLAINLREKTPSALEKN